MTERLEMSPERMIEALNNEVQRRDREIERLKQRDGFISKLDEQILEKDREIKRMRKALNYLFEDEEGDLDFVKFKALAALKGDSDE